MAPAIAEPEIAAETRPPAVGHYGYVELTLEELRPSPLNPRKHFDKQKLDELAASMANGVGVLEPLVVRPVGDERYEIVAGERRFKAAKQAGLAWVPAVVKDLTDGQVVDLMLIENNQRDDLNALEEATGFKTSVKFGITPEDVAHRIGKSAKYVYDRIKLLDLIPDAKEHLLENRITAGHAILIARLKPEDQKRTIGSERGGLFTFHQGLDFVDGQPSKHDKLKAVSVRELEAWIADHIRFDLALMAKAAPLDFGPTAAAVEAASKELGKRKKVVSITHDYNAQSQAASSPDERTYGNTAWRRADGAKGSRPCEHAVLGVVVAGKGYGGSFDVCLARDKCQVHWKAEIAERERNAKRRASGKADATSSAKTQHDGWMEKQRRENATRDRERKAWESIETRAMTQLCEGILKTGVNGRVVEHLMDNTRLHGLDEKLFDKIVGKVTPQNLAIALCVAAVLADTYDYDEFLKFAKHFGIKSDAALDQEYRAAAASPKPVQTSAPKASTKKATKKR